MTNDEMISELSSLIQLDIDAIHAYDQAIKNIDVQEVKTRLTEFRRDHERHVADLSPEVQRLGGKPPAHKPDFKGFVIKGMTAVRSMTGTEGALKAMQTNEKLTNRNYAQATSKPFPDNIKPVLERNAADERRHLEYIEETLRMRPWESTGAHA